VGGDLGFGLSRSTAQRVEQGTVVVGGAAEGTAGPFGHPEGQPLFLLELGAEPGQQRAARRRILSDC
jgi:hypothetical protein